MNTHQQDEIAAKVAKEILWHADAKMEDAGWDQPSQLWLVVYRTIKPGEAAVCGLLPLPGWEMVRSSFADIQSQLGFMVDALRNCPPAIRLKAMPGVDDLFGVALCCEAYKLDSGRNASQEQLDQMDKVARAHTIHEHPNRVEIRIIYLAPLDGPEAVLTHEKGGIAELLDDRDEDRPSYAGEVPRLLKELGKALVSPT